MHRSGRKFRSDRGPRRPRPPRQPHRPPAHPLLAFISNDTAGAGPGVHFAGKINDWEEVRLAGRAIRAAESLELRGQNLFIDVLGMKEVSDRVLSWVAVTVIARHSAGKATVIRTATGGDFEAFCRVVPKFDSVAEETEGSPWVYVTYPGTVPDHGSIDSTAVDPPPTPTV